MSTQRLIDVIMPQMPAGYAESTGNNSVLKLIEEGQEELCDTNSPLQIWKGTDNEGFPPYLTTVADTIDYEITAANLANVDAITINVDGTDRTVRCKKVLQIFIDISVFDFDYGLRYIGSPYVYYGRNPYSTKHTRLAVAPVPAKNWPAYESGPARVQFPEQPTVSAEKYFCEFVWEPTRLTAPTIPLSVPKRYERALEQYAVGTAQQRANGKPSDFLYGIAPSGEPTGFYNKWVPDYQLGEGLEGSLESPDETEMRVV